MTRQATRFRRGQTIGATQLNRVVDLANRLAREEAGAVPSPVGAATPFTLEIKTLGTTQPYTLTCVFVGEAGNPAAFEFTVSIPEIFNEASRVFGGAIGTVNYTYVSINERSANNGTDTETQLMTPPFVVGEEISVEASKDGLVIAMVPDGRMWAVEAP